MSAFRPPLHILYIACVATIVVCTALALPPHVSRSSSSSTTTAINVLSYNIQSGSDMHYRYNLTRQGQVIGSTHPLFHVAVLQEVDNRTRRHWPDDQLAILSAVSGIPFYRLGKMRDFQGGEYGIGIMSRMKMQHDTVFRYHPPGQAPGECGDPKPEDYCQGAIATMVTLDLSNHPRHHYHHGRPMAPPSSSPPPPPPLHETATTTAQSSSLWIVTTHLGIGGFALNEVKQLMLEFVQGQLFSAECLHGGATTTTTTRADCPSQVVLTGDFNAFPDSDIVEYVLHGNHGLDCVDMWTECGDGSPGYTFPADKPNRRIDYQFLCTNRRNVRQTTGLQPLVKCKSAVVIDTLASDHRPLSVEYVWL